MAKTPLDVRVVLVRPRNPLNIGAAARAMANFGFSDMVVVKPYPPIWRETVSAVGAERLVLAARKTDSLDDAVRDRHLVLGTTTGRRRAVRRPLVRLPDLVKFLRNRARSSLRIALLFGSEKTGLANRHLERCHALLAVPTDKNCPSMNLSQAVAVCCYELSRSNRALGLSGKGVEDPPVTTGEIERLSRHALEVFRESRYLDFLPTEERLLKVRRTLSRWRMRRWDVALLHGLFRFALRRLKRSDGKD